MRIWSRSQYTSTSSPARRRARFRLIAPLRSANIDAAVETAGERVANSSAFSALDLEVRARAGDSGRFDQLLGGRAQFALRALDSETLDDVRRTVRYVDISADLEDPPDFSTLHAAMMLLTVLAEEDDLICAIDDATARIWLPNELAALEAARPFSLDEQLQVVVEAVERQPGAGHIVRSRGLAKAGRPDVAARAPRKDAERISEVVRDVARILWDGAALAPGDRLQVRDLSPITVVARTNDCLQEAPPESAPVYEIRDLDEAGEPGSNISGLIRALTPKARLRVVR